MMLPMGNGLNTTQTETESPSADNVSFWHRIMRQERLIWIGAGTLATCLVGLGILVFIALGERPGRPMPASEVPLIMADKDPFKVRPEDPGGLDVPDRDKLVYEQMRGAENVVGVERLLTASEQPLEPPQPEIHLIPDNGAVNDGRAGGMPSASLDFSGIDMRSTTEPLHPADGKALANSAANTAVHERDGSEPKDAEAPSFPAPKARPLELAAGADQALRPVKSGQYHVQLLAVTSTSAAMNEWKRLNSRYGDSLSGLSPVVSRLERNGQSPLFRLRAGPLRDEGEARALCHSLIAKNVGCVVVAPGA